MIRWAIAVLLILVLIYFLHVREEFALFGSKDKTPFDCAYFDYNGTTPMLAEAKRAWDRALRLGNAHAAYADKAREEIYQAEQIVLKAVEVDPSKYMVIWTSGGSESNNLMLRGIAHGTRRGPGDPVPHFILSATEHKTSLECAKQLAAEGLIELTILPVMNNTFVCSFALERALRPNTRLVSIMHVNNESGLINNVHAYAAITKEASCVYEGGILFHSDAVQSMGKIPPVMRLDHLDAVSFSAHKFGGPLGCGGLIIKRSVAGQLSPQICGSQNNGLRGGTDNTPGIVATGKALEISLRDRDMKNTKLMEKKIRIMRGLGNAFPLGNVNEYLGKPDDIELLQLPGDARFQLVPLGAYDTAHAVPNTLWFSIVKVGPIQHHFCNLKLRQDLEDAGVIISTGSACNGGAESHILSAINAPYLIRCGVVRISFGDATTLGECDKLIREMIRCIRLQA